MSNKDSGVPAALNIVFASHSAFDPNLVVGSHHLSRECAKLGHTVLHMSTPITPFHIAKISNSRVRQRIARSLRGPENVQEGLWEWIPFSIIPWLLAKRTLHSRNWFLPLRSSIASAIRTCGITNVDLLIVDEPRLIGIETLICPQRMAYRATDDYSAIKGDPSIRNAERIACRKADKIFATSRPVADQLSKLSGRSVTVIDNGVDLHHLSSPMPEHASLSRIPHPRVVYVGAIDFRFDFDLLDRLAKDFPDVAFVNYGPVTRSLQDKIPNNLHFLGPLPYRELPSVLQHCDVGILPMNLHPANCGRSPMKYYEYIAAGLPVLVRSTPEIERRTNVKSHIYSDTDDASRVLGQLLRTKNRTTDSIQEHGWAQKAKRLLAGSSDGKPASNASHGEIASLG